MEQLYYQDSQLLDFETCILAYQAYKKRWRCQLNRSAFYPEGGGQPADRGWIGDSQVIDVQKENGVQWHYLDKPLPESSFNQPLQASVNKQWRLEYQQQHSAQHLLSALLHRRAAQTVAVRLGSETISIELEGRKIEAAAIEEIEDEANSLILKSPQIWGYFPSEETLKKLQLRRASSVPENIRVVEIAGVDCTPCGGVHCQNLAQLQAVKYFSQDRNHGNQRLYWLAGKRVIQQHRECLKYLQEASTLLAVPPEEISSRLENLLLNQQLSQQRLHMSYERQAELLEKHMSKVHLVFVYALETQKESVISASLNNIDVEVCPLWTKIRSKKSAPLFIVWQGEKQCRWFYTGSIAPPLAKLKEHGFRGGGKSPLWQGVITQEINEQLLDEFLSSWLKESVLEDGLF